jgi:PAS domain S-box-containing protein
LRLINWSRQAEKIFGWKIEEVYGNNPNDWRFIYEEDTEQVKGLIEKLLNGSQASNSICNRNYTKDGSVIHCEWYNSALFDTSGNLVSILSLIQDVTERKRAEEALRQSEERWQLAIRGTNDGIWDWNIKTDEAFFSTRWKEMLGYEDHEIGNSPEEWSKRVHRDDFEQVMQVYENHLTRKTPFYTSEHRLLCKDGTYKWILTRAQALWDEEGNPVRLTGSHTDISDRKQSEEALRESEERFRSAFDYASTGMALVSLEGRFLKVNHSLCKIVGYCAEELLATTFQAITHPDDLEADLSYKRQLLSDEIHTYQLEKRYFHSSGDVVWILLSMSLVRDAHHQPLYFIAQIQDITARKQAQEALRQSEERLQAILDNAPAVIYLKDTEGRFLLINRQCETLFHITNEQVLGLTDYDLFPKEIADTVVAHDRQVIEAGHPLKFEEIAPYEQEIHTYISIKFPLRDDAGVPYGVCGISTDISDRKRAEEALRESQAQLQAILDNSPAVIYLIDDHDRHLLINRGYENLVSVTNEQILGTSIYDVWPHEIADAFAVNNQKVLEGGTPIEVEEVVSHDDGLHTYFSVKFPLRDANGVPYAVCGISTDITERKQAEETLRKQACIFENLYDGVILTDLEGRIIDWNPAAERIFGYTKAEVLGKTTGIVHKPEDSAVLSHKIIKGMLKAGRWAGEINFIRKDGREGVCETVVVPLYNEQGQAIATIGVNSDISDRKQAEAALRRAYDELEIRVQERTRELAQANQELQSENTERKRVEAELQTRARQQAAVAELGQQALASQQLDPLIDRAVALIAQILEVEYCRVLELLPDGKALLLRAGVGWQEGLVGHATISVALESQAGYTLLASEPVVVEDLSTEKRFSGPSLLHQHGVVSGLSVIIPGHNRPYGVLGAHTTRRRKFTKDDVYFLQATANVLATAINRQQAEENLRRAHYELEIRVQERTTDLAKANSELQQEILERKQAEEERAKLIAILEATPDFISSASVDGQVFYFNRSARKILGFGQGDDLRHLDIANGHPDWANEVIEKEGIPAAIRDGSWVGETALLSHDGREIPLSQLIIAHKSPDGSVKMLSTIARDITQQKQIEATLREAERRWRSLLENVRLVVVGLDNNGKVNYVNPYFLELVDYTKAEVIGQDWFETFLPLHQRQRVQNNYMELLEQEFYIHNQNVILTKSGEEKVIAWNNTLLKDLQGNVIGTLSIGEDITERQVIERMKDEFISVVSHELRTPLTSIHGALNLLASGLVNTDSEKGRRVIEIAAESAERLVRLVNDILELERLESGKISLSKQSCNTAELMIQATDMIQVMANRSGITLSVSPKAIQFEADPDRIIQVLTNLLGNAIKFSPRGSTVWLTVELQGTGESGTGALLRMGEWNRSFTEDGRNPTPTVVFKVKDQGRGIPADKIESIFERFHQVDASDSRKKGGTGLGLAICRSIVQQQGGQIWVESTLGEGSSFYFTLPGSTVEEDNHDNQANLGD